VAADERAGGDTAEVAEEITGRYVLDRRPKLLGHVVFGILRELVRTGVGHDQHDEEGDEKKQTHGKG
jgi:hypothetical protein